MNYQAPALTRFLIACYGWCNRSGLLQIPLFRWCFEQSYFIYKSLHGDPYSPYLDAHPLPPGHIIDVGANIGYMTALFRHFLPEGYKVFAFEPEQRNFASLQRRFSKDSRVVLKRAAVGAESGTAELWENPSHHADHRVRTSSLDQVLANESTAMAFTQVPCLALDQLLIDEQLSATDISFVKIDVQGFEIPVLEGMQGLCAANPRLLIGLEYDPQALAESGYSPELLWQALQSLNLAAHEISRQGKLTQITADYFRRREQQGHTDLLCFRV